MDQLLREKAISLGYSKIVCDIFPEWEHVKDEILMADRKAGTGSGTIHVFLGAAFDELSNEFADYFSSVKTEADAEAGAVQIKHYFSKNNLVSMLGYLCKKRINKGEDFATEVTGILRELEAKPVEYGLVSTVSLFKWSTGSNKLRPYFKQFDANGIFTKVVRRLLFADSYYKITLCKNSQDGYAAFWQVGYSDLSAFETDGNKQRISRPDVSNKFIELLKRKKNLILTGAPGTGKTRLAMSIAKEMNAVAQFVQFHPSYDYTDFVEGLRPVPLDDSASSNNEGPVFRRKDGIFKHFCKEALKSLKNEETKDIPFVFIIDEINRGELSKIFGELFFAIDPGYRGLDGKVTTQYQELISEEDDEFKEGFYVPENVYIIGTMNDIDRSVESMDFAVRRRFAWREVSTAESAVNMKLSDFAVSRMDAINAAIYKQELGDAYYIGGAYFRELNESNIEEVWEYHLRGLVAEYFRGNPSCSTIVDDIHAAFINTTDDIHPGQ